MRHVLPYSFSALRGLLVVLVFTVSIGARGARAENAGNPAPIAPGNRVVEDQVWFGPNFASVDSLALFSSHQQ